MKYPVAERFKAVQGEGVYTGTPMAFIRLVGCSVGKGVCHACDTDFDRMLPDKGGGLYTVEELADWAAPYGHACVTGGEPLDRDLRPLLFELADRAVVPHVETSGTRRPDWLSVSSWRAPGSHIMAVDADHGRRHYRTIALWVTVSPKPGYLAEMVESVADEVKVVLGGLGDGPGWPTLDDAIVWANVRRPVYVQPRNDLLTINGANMREAMAVVEAHPSLRLSVQLHKYLGCR